MKIGAAMVDNGFNGEMDVRLVEVIAGPGVKTLPFAGVVFELGMHPDFGLVVTKHVGVV